ncbi:MAG TPA: hypothetical protein VML55_00840 [Planctomycetaceae bacterium]|nr:hypothetical protein [Planctomycetaceae bacterium]
MPHGRSSSSRWCWLFGLLFLADCAKHVLTFSLGPVPIVLDASGYWILAGDAAAGDWLQFGNRIDYRTPLYPIALGVFRGLFGDGALLAAVVWQHVLVVATGLLAALICFQVTGSRWAALAGYGLSAVCLTRPWFANTLLNETLFTFLLTATVAALVGYHRRPSAARSIAWCALLGLTILARPVPQLVWVPLGGLCFYHATRWGGRTQSVRRIAVHVAVGLLALAAVLSPWYVRNWVVFDGVFLARLPAVDKWQVCFQDGAGAHLPIPASPAGERLLALIGTPDGDVPDRYSYAVVAALADEGLSEREIDELVSDVCADAIREHPLEFAWAAFKRFVNFWRCVVAEYPFYAGEDEYAGQFDGQRTWRFEPLARPYERVLEDVPSRRLRWNELAALLCGLGTLLLIVDRRTRVIGLSLAAVFAYFAAVIAAVGIENYRYRMVLEPCMIVAIVAGWFCASRRDRTKRPESVSGR